MEAITGMVAVLQIPVLLLIEVVSVMNYAMNMMTVVTILC